jgi:adenosylcobinamide kinase/adenosylcobinamide-phosphate guanylyltransferase
MNVHEAAGTLGKNLMAARTLVLVTGGASSGKSTAALQLAGKSGRRAFVATGQPLDDEMAERIARHQASRGSSWETVEVPVGVAGWFLAKGKTYDAIVLDCVTLWLSNLREHGISEKDVPDRVEELLKAIRQTNARVIVVTNELGSGLVPMERASRRFRELAGRVNQQLAREADEVYLFVSGLSLRLKPPSGRRAET